MALTIKHLNADASFLLTFEPLDSAQQAPQPPPPSTPPSQPAPPPSALHHHDTIPPSQTHLPTPKAAIPSCPTTPRPFHILLDPWLTGPSTVLHPRISLARHENPPCVASLRDLPEPDLVIISQARSDHCHEATLRQLDPSNPRSLILAVPAAARAIHAWKHFDRRRVRSLRRWRDDEDGTRAGGDGAVARDSLTRIALPPSTPDGEPGEIAIAWIPQRRDPLGLQGAIGMTFRPPAPAQRSHYHQPSHKWTPPRSRTLSLLFSPHGMRLAGPLQSYASQHLVGEAALPLTALLHCLDRVSNPWWLGGDVLLGAPAGREIALALGARAWIGCHDGPKEIRGLATGWLRTRRWCRAAVERSILEPGWEWDEGESRQEASGRVVEGEEGGAVDHYRRKDDSFPCDDSITPMTTRSDCSDLEKTAAGAARTGMGTRVLELACGDEVVLTSDGVCDAGVAEVLPSRRDHLKRG